MSPAENLFCGPDLFEILENMGGQGFDLYLLTNGILMDREKAGRLADMAVKGVQVSLEGPERSMNRIRGKGSFTASLKGINYLLSAGIRVTLNMTLSEINAPYLEEMVGLGRFSQGGTSRFFPAGPFRPRGGIIAPHAEPGGTERPLSENIFAPISPDWK